MYPDAAALIKSVVVAADNFVKSVDYNRELIEKGSGHLSTQDEEEILETDNRRLEALVDAVHAYRMYKKAEE